MPHRSVSGWNFVSTPFISCLMGNIVLLVFLIYVFQIRFVVGAGQVEREEVEENNTKPDGTGLCPSGSLYVLGGQQP